MCVCEERERGEVGERKRGRERGGKGERERERAQYNVSAVSVFQLSQCSLYRVFPCTEIRESDHPPSHQQVQAP